MSADAIMQKVKSSNGYMPNKDLEKVRAALLSNADGLWEGGAAAMGNKKTVDNVVRSMILMRCQTTPHEKTTGSTYVMQLQMMVDAAVKLILNSKTAPKTTMLCMQFLALWCNTIPDLITHYDYTKYESIVTVDAFCNLLVNLGSTQSLTEQALTFSVWITTAGTGKGFSPVQHLAYPPLLHLCNTQEQPTPAAHVALEKTREFISKRVLLNTDIKKNTALNTDGTKLSTSDMWTVMNTPVSTSVGYTDQQEVHAWVFATLPELLTQNMCEQAHTYAVNVLMQIGNYGRRNFLLSTQLGSGLGIAYVEAAVIQLMSILETLVKLHPSCSSELEGEVMGLFFQMLPQSRKSATLPPPRCFSNVAGWTGEDAITKAVVSSAGTRGDKAPPPAVLSSHVPADFHLENITDNVAATEGGETAPVPIWKGSVFIAILEFFATSASDTEAAVVEAFFESPHWVYYPHNVTFAPMLFRYLLKYSNRPSFANVRQTLHLKALRVTSLSPHSCAPSLLKLLPALINRVTYLDLLHRILDLGLMSHLQSKQTVAIDGSNLSQVFGTDPFQLALAKALYCNDAFDNPEESPYCSFWLEHKNSVEKWVSEVEVWPLSRKAVGMTKHIPRLLSKYFNCISFEAERDPIMTVNIAVLILRRYHMLCMPSACAKEVRAFLLQQVYTFISNTPQILDLITDELLSCVRQYHISKKSHRCLYLTGCSAVILSQGVLRVVKPPSEPNPSIPKNVKVIFFELHKALYDVLAILYKREVGMVRSMYTGKTPLFKTSERKKSKSNPNKNLHDTLEAAYTVWDAVECIDCLSVAMTTIGILCPEFLNTARTSCTSVARASKHGVLPPVSLTSTTTLQSWLSQPSLALSSVVRPTPPVGTSPLCTDAQTTLLGLLPRPAHQQFRVV
eukprot:TRINITY_DN9010_c0_g1_i1.p1 TRINITY_DN9010_c0_g1~~TRINITY_DN9010_c0_g1_i1.p1  ORF type:complete len:931 (+),score=245.49 TRINITY_DN9010_c0_g1_i1:87-2795(+)